LEEKVIARMMGQMTVCTFYSTYIIGHGLFFAYWAVFLEKYLQEQPEFWGRFFCGKSDVKNSKIGLGYI
jgi:hypothetical protein